MAKKQVFAVFFPGDGGLFGLFRSGDPSSRATAWVLYRPNEAKPVAISALSPGSGKSETGLGQPISGAEFTVQGCMCVFSRAVRPDDSAAAAFIPNAG